MSSKKGVGSSKNGRDSESKRLGVKAGDGKYVSAGTIIMRQGLRSIRVSTSERAAMIHCLPRSTAT